MKILVGLALIFLASPFTLYWAEGINYAKELKSTTFFEDSALASVSANRIAVRGAPTNATNLACPTGATHPQCLYVKTHAEEFTYKEATVCGELGTDVEVIERVQDACEGGTCEPCYLVNQSAWVTTTDREDYADFTVGAVSVRPYGSAYIVGEGGTAVGYENEAPVPGDERTSYEYLPNTAEVTVAGELSTGVILRGDGEHTLFISNEDYDTTLAIVKSEDKAARMFGRIASLALMMLGFVLVAAQFVDPVTGVMRILPFFGKGMQNATRSVVYLAAGFVGAIIWIPIFIVMYLFHNVWAAIIATVVLGGIAIALMLSKKK